MKITEPGIYTDLPAETYHAQHEWLSASGMKKLLPPSCPAKFKAAMDGGEEHRPQFDLGKAAHTLLLGEGEEFVVVDAETWRSADARDARDAAYAAGKVPLLTADYALVQDMAAAVRAHTIAHTLLSAGTPEVSLFWIDDETGVKCRARLDWLPDKVPGRRLVVPDLKTAASSEPREFARNAARFGYLNQQQHYLDGIRACGLDDDPAFLFVVVEKEPPHVVTVGQFAEPDDLRLARATTDKARRIFRECHQTNTWPGYVDGIADLELPAWFRIQTEESLIA